MDELLREKNGFLRNLFDALPSALFVVVEDTKLSAEYGVMSAEFYKCRKLNADSYLPAKSSFTCTAIGMSASERSKLFKSSGFTQRISACSCRVNAPATRRVL